MSNENAPAPKTTTVSKPFTFDKAKVAAHFKTIEDAVNKVAGKKGHNPFMFLAKYNANDLYARFLKGEQTEDLQTKALAIPTTIPPVLVAPTEPVPVKVQTSPS